MNYFNISLIVLLGVCGAAIAKPQPLTWDEVGNTLDDWGRKINDFSRKAANAAKGMCQYVNGMPQYGYPPYPSYPNYPRQYYPPQYYPPQTPQLDRPSQPNQPWAVNPGFNVPPYPTGGDGSQGNNPPIDKPKSFPPKFIPPTDEQGISNDIPTFPNNPSNTLEQDDMNKAEENALFRTRKLW